MTPASRRKAWWGLGLVLVLVILGGIYFSGLVPLPFGQPKPKALCYVSPKNPNFIKEAPGKDPEGNELVPVYATPASGQPPADGPHGGPHRQAGRQNQALALPHASGNRPGRPRQVPHLRHGPGAGPNRSSPGPRGSGSRRARGCAERAQDQVLGVAHGPRLRPGQTRQGPLRHGHGPGL